MLVQTILHPMRTHKRSRCSLTVVPDNRLPVLFGRLARTEIGFVVNVHAARDPISLFRHMIDESGKFFLCWLVLR